MTRRVAVWVLLLSVGIAGSVILAAPGPTESKRARPPKWDSKEMKDVAKVFLPDAREKLVGDRPVYNDKGTASTAISSDDTAAPAAGGSFAWSKLISPDVLEDEIKMVQGEVSKTVQLPEPFKGGGYKECRRYFSELAVLFGVIAEYDGEVRWKKQAAAVRDLVARAGFNCKVGTEGSFKEAKMRKDDLEGLVRGGGNVSGSGESQAKWDKVSGRPPLMQRIEQAHQQGIAIWTASAGDFSKNGEKLAHEAQLLAVLAEVIQRDGFEYADDETYLEYAKQMQQAALEVADAVKLKNYDQARKASGNIAKACSSCHEGYRSN